MEKIYVECEREECAHNHDMDCMKSCITIGVDGTCDDSTREEDANGN